MTNRRVNNFIDGGYVTGLERNTFENRSPVDGSLVSHIDLATKDDVDRAVAAARAAMKGPWGKMSLDERCKLLHKIADRINERFDEFLEAEIRDTGKPTTLASHIDIPRGAANFRIFADAVKNASTETFVQDTADGGQALNYSIRKPKGVIAVVCPWNLPLLLMTWKVGPALACGNAVIVKPSEETPTTATLLGEVMNEVGVPAGVYNVVNGFGPDSAGQWLTEHPDVDAVTFTGETRTGTAIMSAAARNIADVSFELGGKNPGLIFADCDLETAVSETARAVFANCGQVCLQTERLYVERPIFEAFVEGLKAKAEAYVPGDPFDTRTTIGPLISLEHRSKVTSYFEKAKAEGATVVTGGEIYDMPGDYAKGAWVRPTIWTGLSDDATPVREEIFGPVCHVRPFDEEDEAIALANDSTYGLASMVWTQNLSRAHRVAASVDAGICWVNSWFLRDLRTPFGGSKRSGIGREGGLHSLEFYTELRNVCVRL
jgi:aminomuconate-semialdehyde/2-hydroxymuconate-6-semialdehyde dehydrogenase